MRATSVTVRRREVLPAAELADAGWAHEPCRHPAVVVEQVLDQADGLLTDVRLDPRRQHRPRRGGPGMDDAGVLAAPPLVDVAARDEANVARADRRVEDAPCRLRDVALALISFV